MIHGIAFAFVVVLFGSNFVAIRLANRYIDPMFGAGLRFSIAAGLLIAIVAVMRIPWPRGKALTAAMLYGLIAYGGAFSCLFFALSMMPAAPVAVLFATAPLFTSILAAAFGVEQLTWRKIAGSAAALAGSAWMYRQNIDVSLNPGAFALCLAAAVCAGLSTVLLKRAPRSHPLGTNAVACAVGGALLMAVAFATGKTHADWQPTAIGAMAWIAVLGSVAGFSLVTWLILHWSPTKVNYQIVLSPLIAAVSAALILDEPIRSDLIVGSIGILIGAWAVLGEAAATARAKERAARAGATP